MNKDLYVDKDYRQALQEQKICTGQIKAIVKKLNEQGIPVELVVRNR